MEFKVGEKIYTPIGFSTITNITPSIYNNILWIDVENDNHNWNSQYLEENQDSWKLKYNKGDN